MQWQTSRKMDALKDQTFKSLGTGHQFRANQIFVLITAVLWWHLQTTSKQRSCHYSEGTSASKSKKKQLPQLLLDPIHPTSSHHISPISAADAAPKKNTPPPRPRHVFRNGPSLWGRRVFVTPRRKRIRHQTIQWIPPFVKWKPTIWGLWLSRVTAICHPSKWWSGGWFMILGLPHPVGQKNRGGDFHIWGS